MIKVIKTNSWGECIVSRFYRVTAIVLVLIFSLGSSVAWALDYVIEERTEIILKLLTPLKSGKTPVGQVVELIVEKSIKDKDGTVLIEDGADAYGTVTVSEKNGMFGKAGKLDFMIDHVEAIDEGQVPVRATIESNAQGCTGGAIAGFLFVSVLSCLFRGDNVSVPSGTIFKAYVDKDTPVKVIPQGADTSSFRTSNINGEVYTDGEIMHICLGNEDISLLKRDCPQVRGIFAKGLSSFEDAQSRKANVANQYVGSVGDSFKVYFWSMNNAQDTFLDVKANNSSVKLNKEDTLAVLNSLSTVQ